METNSTDTQMVDNMDSIHGMETVQVVESCSFDGKKNQRGLRLDQSTCHHRWDKSDDQITCHYLDDSWTPWVSLVVTLCGLQKRRERKRRTHFSPPKQ